MRLLLKQMRQLLSAYHFWCIFARIANYNSSMYMKKHLMRLFLLNCLLLLSICVVRAQDRSDFYFTHVNGENGLSASNVKAILQDSYGFMWFGTKNGLNRYDGTSILQFNCDDLVAGVGNHNIAALFEDNKRNLWVGTDRGVYIYDPRIDVLLISVCLHGKE